ncbi:DNA-binding response regulator [Paenibacillus filicis]|uniref:DNA-binding response regulator n=1 Tax=Paenibacillus gyeongsangnamensis TaxID=3388067 RepID=A0ABT4QEW8_9BACL|nr:helix-turn-helix domain-containing protein [Paenibacillus filicis]MCZ8515430.1 DNA-binding response regulator [Paenibacillus filicis]
MDIVILSGYDEFAYAQQGLRYGVADYLLKPVREEQVYEILTKTACKLEAARKAKEQRGFWLQECKKAAEQIAEHVWLLNEEEAIRAWIEFMRRLEIAKPGAGTIRNAADDLIALLQGELQLRGDEESAEMDPVPSAAEDDLLELVKNGLIDIMNRIRQSRNWGLYHPVRKALAFIHDRLSDPELSMQQAAAETGMSISYFSRSFKEEMGISFTEYVIRRRMEHAKELLLEAGSKTYEIAWAVGYMDYPHFAKSFKKWYGLSPTEYKKRMTGF